MRRIRLNVVVVRRRGQSVSPCGEVSESTRHETAPHSRQSYVSVNLITPAGLQLTESALTPPSCCCCCWLPTDATQFTIYYAFTTDSRSLRVASLSCSYPVGVVFSVRLNKLESLQTLIILSSEYQPQEEYHWRPTETSQ